MRPRFRSESGPRSPREGRPLELVRVRGTQRDPGVSSHGQLRRRRRRGRGGRRGARRGLRGRRRVPRCRRLAEEPVRWAGFAACSAAPSAAPTACRPSEQEARVDRGFCRHYGVRIQSTRAAASSRSPTAPTCSVTGSKARGVQRAPGVPRRLGARARDQRVPLPRRIPTSTRGSSPRPSRCWSRRRSCRAARWRWGSGASC